MVKEGEQSLGSAKGHISNLKEAQEKLLEELDATRARLRETTNLLTALQVRTFRTQVKPSHPPSQPRTEGQKSWTI